MHISIDAMPIGAKPWTGISNYIFNLLRSLAEFDAKNDYAIYSMRHDFIDLGIENDNFKRKRVPELFRFWHYRVSWLSWYYTAFPVQLLKDKPEVFLSPYSILPWYCPCPKVIVVYDLVPFIFSNFYSVPVRFIFKMQTASAVKRADRIIAISKSTKNDLVKLLKADPNKISVVYPGFDNDNFKPTNDLGKVEEIKRKYKINGSYILYIGTLEPRKNVTRLIEAFGQLIQTGNIDHKLVITGKRGWLYDDIFKTVTRLGLERDVIFTGYAPYEDLPLLFNGADVFVYPSLYEGFGLPPLEAMACGTPVITSNISSLPEVVGDAAILVDPLSVDEIAKALYQVVSNKEVQEKMRQKGLERAKMFSWEKVAKETLEILEDVYLLHKFEEKI
jgi:glycosyltransferase involved in cell wall biosynthesis